ncbi:MAG: NUDIX hydrolase [Bacteroidales bacterium]|nr:NUDIX hydrolase [Bacteroidales bacterium]
MSFTYKYPRPALTVDCIIFLKEKENYKLLLIKRKFFPFQGQWALPGGFVDINENLETAAARELAEETSLKNIKLTQFHTYGDLNRDPRGRTVSVVYTGFTNISNAEIMSGDDAGDAKWFDINNLPPLAFDHEKIIKSAVKKLIPDK